MIACEQKRRRRKTFCACGQIVASNTSKALQERGRNLKRTETKNEIQALSNTTRDEIKKHANSISTRPNVFHQHFDDESSSARRSHPSFTRRFSKGWEIFRVPLHFRRKPKKIIIQRAQAKSERARYFSLHSRARDTNYALSSLSLSLSLSREADNHRRRQQKRMLYAYLCHFIFMSL